jgi:hypothetical protein
MAVQGYRNIFKGLAVEYQGTQPHQRGPEYAWIAQQLIISQVAKAHWLGTTGPCDAIGVTEGELLGTRRDTALSIEAISSMIGDRPGWSTRMSACIRLRCFLLFE